MRTHVAATWQENRRDAYSTLAALCPIMPGLLKWRLEGSSGGGSLVEAEKLLFVLPLALFCRKPEWIDAFHADLLRFRPRPENLHNLRDEFSERHRMGVVRLTSSHQ